MASIAINSMNVIQACEKAVKKAELIHIEMMQERSKHIPLDISSGRPTPSIPVRDYRTINKINLIKELAEFSEKFGLLSITIDHDDFYLIGEFMTIPTEPKP